MLKTSTDDIYQAIRKRYGGKAQSNPSCCDGEPSCSGEKIYASDLSELPAEVTRCRRGFRLNPMTYWSLFSSHSQNS